ncbi:MULTISPECIES: DMT family transporter [unclassified Streptomyces]|uniref:DMT family transporter n=1 Tax=unclassified Streptomyces TaxID=2593676 RepID=UPI000DB92A9A|nr:MULTISPECIES: DMT family transporter [unclassified Streptomyces]MYT71440.1 EamA family transporter [Streptomyces sp. SID8367]RAJ82901.1 drug/metabolite transporter (DMT)-like permease [Streptomyces sp. PsTaAH-137]
MTPQVTSPDPRPAAPGLLTVGAVCFTVLAWASAFVSIRSAGAAYSPGPLALGRLLAGSVVLVALLLIRREGLPPRGARRGIVISGVVWFGGYMVALNWGERLVDAGTAALLVNVGPILMALLAARLLGEGLPPRLLTGMLVSFAGAVVVGLSMSAGSSGSGDVEGSSGELIGGVALCLLAAVAYAVGVVSQKPALSYGSPLQVTTFACLIGTAVCLPFSGQLVSEAADAPVSATLNMVYLGVVPTALAFTTWTYALARTPAGKMGATTYAVPAIVVLLSWLFLDEVPGWLTLLGGALCLAGVAVSRSRARARAAVREPETVPGPERQESADC